MLQRCLILTLTLSGLGILAAHESACSNDEQETGAACTLPTGVPASDDFCVALATYDGRCGHCADCVGRNLEVCQQRGAAISAAHRAAFIACKDSAPCSELASYLGCIQDAMAKATPTAAQLRAKDAYCAECPGQARACDTFFAVKMADGQNGAGYSLLLAGDATADKAVTTCASKCDPFEYGVCVSLISCGEEGGDSCQDSGLCARR